MMKQRKFLLIQFRSDQSGPHEHSCLLRHGALHKDELVILNALHESLPNPEELLHDATGVILGGSGEHNLSEPEALRSALAQTWQLIDYLIAHDIPTLGACFGHQLIGARLGGELVNHLDYAETGTFEIHLTPAGEVDPLFTGMPTSFHAQVGHKDSLIRLPKEITLLARSHRSPVHAFRAKQHVYGVQFHPELSLDDLIFRIQLYPEYLHGKALEEVREDFLDSPHAPQVFRNFLRIAERARMRHAA